ncbi:hypothetical protein IWX90DRAFT_6134 [Phyllosticta citrichinensis]|uniref:Secreted protein n=1 Tax=Phyllosticta citrichinensis TaxID=1130410 RepID=A0ABR1Y5A8_9PEZI
MIFLIAETCWTRVCPLCAQFIGFSFFLSSNNWPRGPMARRLTTNQEIAGSIPAVVIKIYYFAHESWCCCGGALRAWAIFLRGGTAACGLARRRHVTTTRLAQNCVNSGLLTSKLACRSSGFCFSKVNGAVEGVARLWIRGSWRRPVN